MKQPKNRHEYLLLTYTLIDQKKDLLGSKMNNTSFKWSIAGELI